MVEPQPFIVLFCGELFNASAPFFLENVVVIKVEFLQQVIEGPDLRLGEVPDHYLCHRIHPRNGSGEHSPSFIGDGYAHAAPVVRIGEFTDQLLFQQPFNDLSAARLFHHLVGDQLRFGHAFISHQCDEEREFIRSLDRAVLQGLFNINADIPVHQYQQDGDVVGGSALLLQGIMLPIPFDPPHRRQALAAQCIQVTSEIVQGD